MSLMPCSGKKLRRRSTLLGHGYAAPGDAQIMSSHMLSAKSAIILLGRGHYLGWKRNPDAQSSVYHTHAHAVLRPAHNMPNIRRKILLIAFLRILLGILWHTDHLGHRDRVQTTERLADRSLGKVTIPCSNMSAYSTVLGQTSQSIHLSATLIILSPSVWISIKL